MAPSIRYNFKISECSVDCIHVKLWNDADGRLTWDPNGPGPPTCSMVGWCMHHLTFNYCCFAVLTGKQPRVHDLYNRQTRLSLCESTWTELQSYIERTGISRIQTPLLYWCMWSFYRASAAASDAQYWYINSVRLSVCPSVRDTLALYENGSTYRHSFSTIR